MKHIVTISELHKLIPETSFLEGKNFNDLRHLLASVIEAIERSGAWEYVQYISGKAPNPSLFIVKEKEIVRTYVEPNQKFNPSEEIKNHYNPKDISVKSVSKSKKEAEKETETRSPQKEKIETTKKFSSTDKIFEETKLPWSQH